MNANVVVAKDGTGKYKTVTEAMAAAPENSNTRYVIYVKKGVYKETIDIGKKKKNIMLVGDGRDTTIITGSLNVVDGSTTFRSATVGNITLYILIVSTSHVNYYNFCMPITYKIGLKHVQPLMVTGLWHKTYGSKTRPGQQSIRLWLSA